MEEELAGGNSSTVARKGDKIYRNAGPWTPTIHKLLNELHRNNIPEVPTAFGIDDQGREVLSFMSGEVANYPLPAWLWSESILNEAFHLMRRMHDAVRVEDFKDSIWQNTPHEPQEVICHNDFAPYNMVFEDGHVVGVIDLDNASPGPRIWDFSYLAYRLVPFCEDAGPSAPQPSEARLKRLRRAVQSYGMHFDTQEIFEVMATRLRSLAEYSEDRSRETGQMELMQHAAMYQRDAYKVHLLAEQL